MAFAEIPTWLAGDSEGGFRLRTDLVAVTPDGSVHVLDGQRLVVARYAESGALEQTAFLPEPMRGEMIGRHRGLASALGGPGRVLSVQTASQLQSLSDGRLFVRITWGQGRVIGYVLDPDNLEAVPVLVPAGRALDWMFGRSVHVEGEQHLRIFAARDEEIVIARLIPAEQY